MNIAIITGTRAEFGIWLPILHAIQASAKLFLTLIATGMHLQPRFGMTIRDIEAAGFQPLRIPMYKNSAHPHRSEPPADSLARAIAGLARAYRKIHPDLVMVLGDRLEMLAAASAALTERIPIAHLHGGESAPGIWDEQIRHAITKMAHLHFCATAQARRRILAMGEHPRHVHLVGAPALDAAITFARQLPRDRCTCPIPLLVLHPSSTDDRVEFQRASMLIQSLRHTFPDRPIFAIGPNNDPGHQGILRAYRTHAAHLRLATSIPQRNFWQLLTTCGMLIGNSSSGILEAASLGIPVINIGDRQAGRERNPNVIDIPWTKPALTRALHRLQHDTAFLNRTAKRHNLYGDGRAAPRILKILHHLAAHPLPLEKRFITRARR